MKKVVAIIFAFAFLVLSGCSNVRLTDFTVISTKNVDWSRAAAFTRGKDRVTGVDKVSMIITIPLGVPNMKQAIDNAIQSVPGCVALADGVVHQKTWTAILYGEISYIVEGTPLIDPKLGDNKLGNYLILACNKQGNVTSIKSVTEDEYNAYKAKLLN